MVCVRQFSDLTFPPQGPVCDETNLTEPKQSLAALHPGPTVCYCTFTIPVTTFHTFVCFICTLMSLICACHVSSQSALTFTLHRIVRYMHLHSIKLTDLPGKRYVCLKIISEG